jgi:hypothetical protein
LDMEGETGRFPDKDHVFHWELPETEI